MAGGYVSVAEAAERLGVHPQRVHQRIREGSLAAEKVGNQWAVEVSELRRVRHHAGPGRPLSSKSAWDLLAVALDDRFASELSPSARSRARARLLNLVSSASDAELEDAAALLAHSLRNRADRSLYAASPRDLPDVRGDERIRLSGVSSPEANMAAGDIVEGYVYEEDVDDLVEDYLLSRASRDRANVILHVVASEIENPAMDALDAVARSPLALAADLAEHDGAREKVAAVRSVADLHAWLVGNGARVIGEDRG